MGVPGGTLVLTVALRIDGWNSTQRKMECRNRP